MTLNKLRTARLGRAARLGACDEKRTNDTARKTEAAKEAAGDGTIASGLGERPSSQRRPRRLDWMEPWVGPDPIPCWCQRRRVRQASGGLARQADEAQTRAELTGVLTYHILPGAILAADIDKAIETGGGQGAARDHRRRNADRDQGGRRDRHSPIGAGTKAPITAGDEKSPTAWSTASMPC